MFYSRIKITAPLWKLVLPVSENFEHKERSNEKLASPNSAFLSEKKEKNFVLISKIWIINEEGLFGLR